MHESKSPEPDQPAPPPPRDEPASLPSVVPREIGGRTSGLDPTRYGDWEKNGRCIDF